jgi:hypothetical protein
MPISTAGKQTRRDLPLTILLAGAVCFSCVESLSAQSSDTQPTPQSWTDTSDLHTDGANPTHVTESHSQSGNRTVDHQSIERLGADGNYEPYQDIEKETVKVDANTVRTVTHTFGRDADGAKTLLQVTDEEQRTTVGGGSSLVRSTSNPDADGNLQVVQREIQNTTKLSKNVEETKTTVMLPGPDGGLAPAVMTEERSTQNAGTVDSQKTTLRPDGNGNWQVSEVKETTTQEQGNNRTTDEKVSRPDADGRLSEISHKVSNETTSGGEKKSTEEDYSLDVPGAAEDGSLHLVKRATTTQSTTATGQQTNMTQIAQPNPADPGAGLQVTIVTSGGVRAGPAGARGTQTLQQLDANGDLSVVSVDTTQSSNNHAVQVQIAPAEKSKQ